MSALFDPAFPSQAGGGVSTRDYFAAAALTGLTSALAGGTHNPKYDELRKELAQLAYAMADDMLSARRK